MKRIIYRDSVLDEVGEECSENCIVRYYQDKNNWIDVTATPRGVEVRSVSGGLVVSPSSGNTVEIYHERLG